MCVYVHKSISHIYMCLDHLIPPSYLSFDSLTCMRSPMKTLWHGGTPHFLLRITLFDWNPLDIVKALVMRRFYIWSFHFIDPNKLWNKHMSCRVVRRLTAHVTSCTVIVLLKLCHSIITEALFHCHGLVRHSPTDLKTCHKFSNELQHTKVLLMTSN